MTLDRIFRQARSLFLDKSTELIVVSQDRLQSVFNNSKNINIRVVELHLPIFNKAKMVNKSVKEAYGEIIIMLDGDRLFPDDYFTNVFATIKKGEIVTTLPLYKLSKNYTATELATIPFEKLEKITDFRCEENIPGKKNAFSGNTIMYKSDFWLAGGMDESYQNYGCTDLDFTKTCINAGLKIIYRTEVELHLMHSFDMPKSKFLIINCKSVLKYCRKWTEPIPPFFLNILKDKQNMVMMP
jgi:predicted glycosyltransferase involved in capsule biosynthesis